MKKTSSKKIKKEFEKLRDRLLDLTLRNPLLNFKPRAKTLTIINQSPTNIYHTLVLQKRKMYFVANKKEKEKKSKFSIWDHSPIDLSIFTDGDKTLKTDLTPNELQKRSFYINQQANTMIEEQGYNVLYLAVGFLEWIDPNKKKQKNLAPLVLIPVKMERKKVGKSFELSWTGEEIQTNISLKAKLDEEGIKLPEFKPSRYTEAIEYYIKDVNNAVRPFKSWKVNSNISLGFFSFTKFVMYNDLNPESWDENVDLTKNELIESIFNPNKNLQTPFNEEKIDDILEYKNMYQVLDADSSQIAAIEDVKAGHNLVVEGPPGTGKSQTIVNLIVELLAEGKSVLFVSEKMAALEVVKDRLTNVGLGKFVLELHSHKTRRKKLLKELQRATNVREDGPVNVDQILRKLETLRKQLDEYSEVIHEPLYTVNLSAFQLYGMKESADDHFAKKDSIIPLVKFPNPEDISLKDLDDTILKLENLTELYLTISNENPWSKCAPKSLLPSDLREIEILINDTLNALDNFLIERNNVFELYGVKKPESLKEFKESLDAFELLEEKNSSLVDNSILQNNSWSKDSNAPLVLIQKLDEYQKSTKILKKFNDSILRADINSLIREASKISNKKFRLFKSKENQELVEEYYKGTIPNIKGIIVDLKMVKDCMLRRKELLANNDMALQYFGRYWSLSASIKELNLIRKWMNEFIRFKNEGVFSDKTIQLLSNELYEINPSEDLADYLDTGAIFVKKLQSLNNKLNPRSKLIFKRDMDSVTFDMWKNQLISWRGHIPSLHLWSQYLNRKISCKGNYAELFVDTIEKRDIKKDDVKSLVLGNFADSLLNILFSQNPALASFIGELHENRIKEFQDLDRKIINLNRQRVFHKLNKNIPQIFGATNNYEAKILAGEFTRKSGHLPVRKLLEKAGGLIKQIKPCFMMSPLSIAQYLDPTNEKLQFDVVIFDEASQVKPEDALGAFMRGKTAVVMGDTQQLPPTSFFDQIAEGNTGEDVATALDMESILHLCKLSFSVRMLKWHYRSRHESLIAVSNKEFYDNDLLIYPSPSHNNPELGLKFHYNPNTSYDRGKSSSNRQEARDVVEEIFNHFDKFGDTKSLGVGTFSVSQRNAILEELEIERKNRPELEPLFSENREERFFVKNLETIQGDERDVMLISVGYGYDENHKMSLNFGPLNQDGGERRLNVLITRAREKCVVFSNFKAYDMNLTNNSPFGVRALREFLEFAENTTLGTVSQEEFREEPFEDAIYSFLVDRGYKVEKHIGCAGFRVDLAIVDDENPGKYILGITTDGKIYSSSKVARDRDRLREQVLEGLGWRLYKLWSTDWYRNRDLSSKRLIDAIEKAKVISKEEEIKRSEEAKKRAKKLKEEAEKKAEELRKARQIEEAEAKKKELLDNKNPDDSLDVEDLEENSYNDLKDYKNNEIEEEDISSFKDEEDISSFKGEEKVGEEDINSFMDEKVEEEDISLFKGEEKVEEDNFDLLNTKESDDLILRNPIDNDFVKKSKSKEDLENNKNFISDIKFKPNIDLYDDFEEDDAEKEEDKSLLSDINEDISKDIKEYGTYEGVSDITNPLKKNSIYHEDFDYSEDKSVVERLSELKNEFNYIKKSLNEIENPTPAQMVSIIDRTKEYEDNESISENKSNSVENKEDSFEPISNNNSLELTKKSEKESKDDDVIIPIHQVLKKEEEKDQVLENIIKEVDSDYKELEREQYRANNKLKSYDDVKLPKRGKKIEDNIVAYEEAFDIGLKPKDNILNKSNEEVSNAVKEIVKVEGPINTKEIIQRIKDVCEIKRATPKIKSKINAAIKECEKEGNIFILGDFVFNPYSSDIKIRKRNKPNIDLISNEEIEENLLIILEIKPEIDVKDLTKKASRNFGFKSTSKKTASKINSVIDKMITEGKVVIHNNKVELK